MFDMQAVTSMPKMVAFCALYVHYKRFPVSASFFWLTLASKMTPNGLSFECTHDRGKK